MTEGRRATLEDLYAPNLNDFGSSVAPPIVEASNFMIKPALIQLVRQEQFGGLEEEDPNQHIHNFLQICRTIKMDGVPDEAIKMYLFEFSLRGEAKLWLQSFPIGYFTTWEALVAMFLAQYFPPERYNHYRAEISCFKQRDGESMSEAWRRFKTLLRKCPHHGFSNLQQVYIFYNGLKSYIRALVDASAGGSLRKKDANEARSLIETMAHNWHEAPSDFYGERREVMELDHDNALLAQNKLLSLQLETLTKQLQVPQLNSIQSPSLICDFCGGGHQSGLCGISGVGYEDQFQRNHIETSQRSNLSSQANAYYLPSFPKNPPSSTQTQPFTQNLPSFIQKPPQFSQEPHFNPNQSHFTPNHSRNALTNPNVNLNPQGSSSTLENMMMSFMQETQSIFKTQEASIRNLESQIGQISKQLTKRTQEAFPSDTIEHCHTISTRSGRVLENENEDPNVVVVEKRGKSKGEKEVNISTILKEVEEPKTNERFLEDGKVTSNFVEIKKPPNEEIPYMKVEVCQPLVGNISKKDGVNFEVEQVLASPNRLIVDGGSKKVEEFLTNIGDRPIAPCLYSNPLFEDGQSYILQSSVYSNPLFEEDSTKENIVEFEENEEIKDCISKLEVRTFVPCVHYKSFFEDSANYILQPQGLHPILREILNNEATLILFDPPHVSIPWDPGGYPFDKLLASNFKPP